MLSMLVHSLQQHEVPLHVLLRCVSSAEKQNSVSILNIVDDLTTKHDGCQRYAPHYFQRNPTSEKNHRRKPTQENARLQSLHRKKRC